MRLFTKGHGPQASRTHALKYPGNVLECKTNKVLSMYVCNTMRFVCPEIGARSESEKSHSIALRANCVPGNGFKRVARYSDTPRYSGAYNDVASHVAPRGPATSATPRNSLLLSRRWYGHIWAYQNRCHCATAKPQQQQD